jgi:hypothetical protein
LLIGNHCFPPDALPSTIDNYFSIFKSKLDSKNCWVVLLGDFNNPDFNWECGLPLSNCHYYSKLKADAIYTCTCFVGPTQIIDSACDNNMLGFVFTNFDISGVTLSDVGMVKADIYHKPMVIYIDLMCYKSAYNHEISYRNYAARDYSMLCNNLLNYGWSLKYITTHQWLLQFIVLILLSILQWTSRKRN